METKFVIATDIDGTLADANDYPGESIIRFCTYLVRLGIDVVPCSGKSCDYLDKIAQLFNARLVIAENGSVYKEQGKYPVILYGERISDLRRLRQEIGLTANQEGVVTISLDGKCGQVAVEEGKYGVLTIFPEIELVRHRWKFQQSFTRGDVYNALRSLIQKKSLYLHVLKPHDDGAVDIVRLDYNGDPITKRTLPEILKIVYGNFKACMLGDGMNDIPAMTAPGIVGITFSNAKQKVQNAVYQAGGIVTKREAPHGGGPAEGILKLAKQGFFGSQSKYVIKIVQCLFPEVIQTIETPPHWNDKIPLFMKL